MRFNFKQTNKKLNAILLTIMLLTVLIGSTVLSITAIALINLISNLWFVCIFIVYLTYVKKTKRKR